MVHTQIGDYKDRRALIFVEIKKKNLSCCFKERLLPKLICNRDYGSELRTLDTPEKLFITNLKSKKCVFF